MAITIPPGSWGPTAGQTINYEPNAEAQQIAQNNLDTYSRSMAANQGVPSRWPWPSPGPEFKNRP